MDKINSNENRQVLKKNCDKNIARTIELAHEMINLSNIGVEQQKDPGCGILYGVLMDSGYRILDLAQKEKEAHILKGWWDQTIKKRKKLL